MVAMKHKSLHDYLVGLICSCREASLLLLLLLL
jgi:hypothetical protein